MNRLLFNGRFLSRRPTGVDRFAFETLRALAVKDADSRPIQVVVPVTASIPDGRTIQGASLVRHGRLGGHAWEQIELAWHDEEKTLISLCNTGPIARTNQVAVIHDAAIFDTPDNYSTQFRVWYRFLFAGLEKRCRKIATVSRFSADRLAHHLGTASSRFTVLPESGEHILRQPPDNKILERLGVGDRPFVLTVGSTSRNKNMRAVVDAMPLIRSLSATLVVTGGFDSRVFASGGSIDQRAVVTGYLEDSELRSLYEHAACFVFPSLYEGYGLPPLEAMSCGCPVLSSNRASMPEVCGSAALFFDPTDPADLSAKLSEILRSSALRAELS
ncbi:MAG TPA: glycosyltransferase family 1 protein, partial [Promineifilum sp.]|nr:glycosyltransferase family 1 protein [Promineifilum sp.]